jgi:esterase/lipase superfamily enzyme
VRKYFPDTDSSENSELKLLNTIRIMAKHIDKKELSVLAHSHGNKLLVRALNQRDDGHEFLDNSINRIILIEPDVEVKFLESRIDNLFKSSKTITLYHSQNDRALMFAEIIFGRTSAGRVGLRERAVKQGWVERMELIDATLVSEGLSKHAPHIDAPEVVNDIYDLLKGVVTIDRFHLREVDRRTCRWQVTPR